MKPSSVREFLDALIQIRDSEGQLAFAAQSGFPPSDELIESLSDRIREYLPKDRELAEALTATNLALAAEVDSPGSLGFANLCQAYVFMNMKKCADAQPFYEKAAELFAEAGSDRDLGRMLCAEAENLTYLSQYDRARRLAEQSAELLTRAEDTEYIPRIHVALGNLFNRINRFVEALAEFDQARSLLEGSDQYLVVAAVELNRAGVLTDLNRFEEAIRGYETAREYCERHEIVLWADILDRNIADLYFKRGSYSAALRSLEKVRPRYQEQGDDRRLALSDLARAEIYLQLNLAQEAGELAEKAQSIFERHSNRSEAAQCLTLVGIARLERGEDRGAAENFRQATEMFEAEGNAVSAAAARLQLARLEQKRHDHAAAISLALSAALSFESEQLAVRGAYARITMAESLSEQGRVEDAIGEARGALEKLADYHARWVSYQCYNLLGTLEAAAGRPEEAEPLYMKAIEEMESLRGNIRLDEFRMSFGRDKYQVYENLVDLKFHSGAIEEAFSFVERSKSRTLIDLLENNTDSLWQSDQSSPKQQMIQKLRQDLNGLYSRLSQAGTTISKLVSDKEIQAEIAEREREMLQMLREAGSEKEDWAALETMPMPTVADIQAILDDDEILVEYYPVKGNFCAFVIGSDQFHLVRSIAPELAVRTALKGLNFQLAKFHLGEDYLKRYHETLLVATRHHLEKLHDMLIAPLVKYIEGRSLALIPHGVLHYVPFQALYDGKDHLIDGHDIVYSASATVLKICRMKQPQPSELDLVLAVPDEATPAILEEAEALRELLPNAHVFVGEDAKADLLREYGARAGKLHIAAHGVFRSDNPMFSALRLGDSWLNLVDIFNLKLGAELTTLSACETGMSALYEGDELLGLTRGFLYAGTPSLVVSLWRVSDRSTTLLMRRFYEGLGQGLNKPKALQQAALAVKKEFPHPYHWAPFILMGKS